MKKIAYISLLVCFCSSAVMAQSEDEKAGSSSVYSKLGVGYPVDIANTAAQSMGLSGVSYNETYVPSLANPAHWGNTVYGLGSGGVKLKRFDASDNNGSVQNSQFTINQFQLQLPLVRGRLGVSASFSPVTQAGFRTFRQDVRFVGRQAVQDTLAYGIENKGSGGVNRAELGFGWQITPNISVGYAASAIFMSLDDTFSAFYGSEEYAPVTYDLETNGVGFGNRFGTFIRIPGIFRETDRVGIGATVNLPVTIDAERKQTSDQGFRTVPLTDAPNLGDGNISLPLSYELGLSYWPSELTMFAAEGTYEQWSDFENDFKPSEDIFFADRYKMGLGFQYFPYITGSNKFLSYFKYRLGASYDTGHLEIRGQKVNTLKFSVGLGIPSPRNNSNPSIDVSLEYGIRGTKSADLVKEQIWGVRLSVNLAELMFFRPKLQ